MIEITKYMADDGTIFDSEDDCREYEIRCRVKNNVNDIKLWVKKFDKYQELEINQLGLHHATLCYVKDEDSSILLKELGEEWGYPTPTHEGLWVWDETIDEWRESGEFEEIFENIKFMKKQVNKEK